MSPVVGRLLPLMFLIACSGAGAGARTVDGAETDDSEPPADESAYDRKLRLAKDKRLQCDALATAIEGAQGAQAIININDSQALNKLAAKLESSADSVAAVEATVPQLGSLRDSYVELERGKATALKDTAVAKSAATQKGKLREYQQLDSQVGDVIDDINAFCGAATGD
ncbi:MAG: hypothetical protein DRI90_25065 [Deltaproteobacteria bacterium]|nr:MAG: hypothetical protein DRI90_25065 [Deltaproteobacteria bacterium]